MKALSLTQPWAQLIAIGAKRIETRSWSTPCRGELAIHASKSWQAEDRETCWLPEFRAALEPTGLVDYTPYVDLNEGDIERFMLPLGAIVATVRLGAVAQITDSHGGPTSFRMQELPVVGDEERAFGDYYPGRWAWFLHDVRRLRKPIPCKGALGIWTVPPDVARLARTQIIP